MRALLSIGIVAMCLLSACGGSGDSGDGGTALPPVNRATITSSNAAAIAAATLNASLQTDGLSDFAGVTAPTAALNDAPQALFATIGDLQQAGTAQLSHNVLTSNLVMQAEIVECALTGMVTVTADVGTAGTLSAGDSITAEYVDCSDEPGIVIDGSFSMTVNQFGGDLLSGQILLSVQIAVVEFTVSDGEQQAVIDGTLSMSMDTRTPPVTTVTVTAASLSVSDGVTGHTLSDFTSAQTIDSSATTHTLELSGSLTSSAFDGQVDFETTALLESFADGFAFTGEILITGADNATIRIVIVDSVGIRLEIDLDGDTSIDDTIEVTWQELLSAA